MSGLGGLEIIDPDAISRIIARRNSTHAAREALHRRRAVLNASRAHLVETALTGAGIHRHMVVTERAGFWTVLHFVSVDSPDQAFARIRTRVALGGHNVLEADARQPFSRLHANLPVVIARSDVSMLYDNADLDRPRREVGIPRNGTW